MRNYSTRLASMISALLLTLLMLPSCTHNNGDIGNFFGKWKLTTMTTGSAEAIEYQGDIYWNFQSGTISMQKLTDNHTLVQTYGNWSAEETTLTLNFPDKDLGPLAELGLPRSCSLIMEKQTSKEMTLRYQPAEDKIIIYSFRKW